MDTWKRRAGLALMPVLLLVLVAIVRLDVTVLSFIFGFVVGVLAGILPTATITYLVIQQRERQRRRDHYRYGRDNPPVVVVAGGGQQPQVTYPQLPGMPYDEQPWPPGPPRPRGFTIIGDEVLNDGAEEYDLGI